MTSEDDESKLPSAPWQHSNEPPLRSNEPPTEELRRLFEDLRSQLTDLDRLPPQAVIETVQKVIAYKGSWPPAEIVKELEAALPGSGERLLRWTEQQTNHRQELERIQVLRNETRMDRGQSFGPIIGFPCLGGAIYLIASLNNTIGLIGGLGLAVTGIVTPSAIYIARGISHWLGHMIKKARPKKEIKRCGAAPF